MSEIELFHDWYERVIDDAKAVGALMGIDIDRVYFSGFWSQGDGACFEGSFSYRAGCVAAIKTYAPNDTELHTIARAWQDVQKAALYQIQGSVKHSGHYYHEYCTDFTVERIDKRTGYDVGLETATEEAVKQAARDLMRWIYDKLESEYEYQYAWEAARQWQDAQEDMVAARAAARALVKDMRAALRAGQSATASIFAALRSQLRGHIDTWEERRETRANLANDFAYWQDGKRLTIAEFAEGHL